MGDYLILAAKVIGLGILLYCGYHALRLAVRAWVAWRVAMRAGVALKALVSAVMGAAYGLSPVDAVPDVFVGVGWVDDLIVLMAVWFYIKHLGRRLPLRQITPAGIGKLPG
ncbi:MAG: DUF1232 domain-containing protein [Bryobacterales bacterium]|nr:DUF1232 domain-containing protein [Bryobacterales bacterium]